MTAGALASMVAVTVLAGCSVHVSGGDAAPTTSPTTPSPPEVLADLTVGAAAEVPWWQHGVLHVGEVSIRTTYRDLVFGAGTTLVGRGDFERGSRWFLVDGADLVPLLTSPGLVRPVVSAGGATLAWSDPVDATTRHLVAYDAGTQRELGARDVDVHPVCCDAGGELMVNGVGLDGRVVYSVLGAATHLWTPGGTTVELTGVDPSLLDGELWPGGVMWQVAGADSFAARGGYGTVDASGAVTKVGRVETDQLGTWSPDGTAYAYPGATDGTSAVKAPLPDVWVDHTDTGERTRLELPTGRQFQIVAWESADRLVLQTRNAFGEPAPDGEPHGLVALVRCDTTTGACERTADGPQGNPRLPDPH